MGYWSKLRLKTINFYKRNKKAIFIFIIIWLIVIIINMILKNQPPKMEQPSTTYTPHISVLDDEKETPEKYHRARSPSAPDYLAGALSVPDIHTNQGILRFSSFLSHTDATCVRVFFLP